MIEDNKEGLTDLHVHSCYSDGEYSPNEIIKQAVDKNITTIAITDHDTLLGNKNIIYGKKETSLVRIISGIELSAKVDKGSMHILGYGIDINDRNLNKKMIELKNNSIYSIMGLMYQLKKDYNIVFNSDDIRELFNANRNIGRPDLAKLCIKYNYATTVQEAFEKYLLDAYKKTTATNKGIPYEECIELIANSGGIPVLAHPVTLKANDEELKATIEELVKYGLQGLEVYHSSHSPQEIKKYLKIAEDLELLISGGSDYHGPTVKPNIELGTGINNNLKVKKLTLLDQIKIS